MLLLAVSCKTQRSIIKEPLKSEGEKFLIDKMADAEFKYTYFNARCNVTLIDDKKNSTELRGQLRIQKDSIIWISLSPALGIEAARLMVTNDSIRFINRIDKTFFEGDISLVNNYFLTTIDFDILQALITGNDIEGYEDGNFRASIDAMQYRLTATNRVKQKKYLKQKDTPNVLVQNIWLNPNNFKIMSLNIKEFGEENKRLQAFYDDFETINGQMVPASINFELQGGKKINLKIKYSRIELDILQTFPFKIPDNYTEMK
jgi:hypothetical protein